MSAPDVATVIQRNLQEVSREMADACVRSGRSPDAAQLVAVTKYAEWSWVEALSGLHRVFGENRPQQLAERKLLLPDVAWHLIGQLQRNKVALICGQTALIHSVDSLRLLERIAETARSQNVQPRILLQVNVSGEQSKSGFRPEELISQWSRVVQFAPHLQIAGLMTMAAESPDPEDARPVFRSLRQLRDRLSAESCRSIAGLHLAELSMGMSSDFVPAIEEGATLVRIGSRLFAGLEPDCGT